MKAPIQWVPLVRTLPITPGLWFPNAQDLQPILQ